MINNYCLILKTGESEIRAIQNSRKEVLEKIFPLIEITRGRKKVVNGKDTRPFDTRIDKLKDCFKGYCVGIDVTSIESLLSDEVESLYEPLDGYSNWINYLQNLSAEHCFSEIIPTILINNDDEYFEENLRRQVEKLSNNYSSIIYRTSLDDDQVCYDDLALINDVLTNKTSLYVLIDCEYTSQSSCLNTAEKCIARIRNIKSLYSQDNLYFIVSSTSFPNNITEISDTTNDEFYTAETSLIEYINKVFKDVIYSDYGSISMKRNDDVVMARGWIPRIDVPTGKSTFYYKQRRPKGVSAYSATYNAVAKSVIKDVNFPKNLKNWGVEQIIECAKGATPSSAPSFWISVRMCIHLELQVRRLGTNIDITT